MFQIFAVYTDTLVYSGFKEFKMIRVYLLKLWSVSQN